jgi:hypothetical protein
VFLRQWCPSIKHITKAAVKPAFTCCVVAPAVDVFVYHAREVPAKTRNFLLQTKLRVLHQSGIATVPEFAMPLDRPGYAVAYGFDHVFLYHFALQRRQFLVPVHDLGSSTSRRSHGRYSTETPHEPDEAQHHHQAWGAGIMFFISASNVEDDFKKLK